MMLLYKFWFFSDLFDLQRINFWALYYSFLPLLVGIIVGGLFYLFLPKKYRKLSLKECLIIGGLAAFLEDAVLQIFRLDFLYFDVDPYLNSQVFNAVIFSFFILLAVWIFKE